MKPKEADWTAIKSEYIAGSSFYALEKKHGVARSTISDRCKREHWRETSAQIAAETERKLIDKISDERADKAVSMEKLKQDAKDGLWRVLNRRVSLIDDDTPSADIRRYFQCYVDMQSAEPVGTAEETESSGLIEALKAQQDALGDDDSDFLPEDDK